MSDSTRQILDCGIDLLQSGKAEDIQILDLRNAAEFTDYFLICTGNSDVHVKAVADAVLEGMKAAGHRPWQVEGYDSRKWILIDFVDVIVHIFLSDTRSFYRLERLWGDVPTETVEENTDLVETNWS